MKSLKYWNVGGFEVATYEYTLSDRIYKTYKTSGSDDTGLCTYTYNELGFRGDSVHKKGYRVMSIGCSNTEGVGVNDNETWPFLFTSMIPNGVNMNFGHGGRSNDYISRCLLTYYDLIQPDLVLIMYTESHRREYYTKDGGIEPFHSDAWGYFEKEKEGIDVHSSLVTISNRENDFQNWYKNHLLISQYLELKNCNWLWNGWFATNHYTDDKRFDGEYYPFVDNGVDGKHPGPKTNKEYAEKLYNYTKELGYLKKKPYISKNKNKLL